MKKILSLLLILCILCLVGCGNGEPPTSNGGSGQNVAFADTEWAVYDGYGVTMEYPSTWTLYCYAESASAANYSVLMVSTAEDIFLRCYVTESDPLPVTILSPSENPEAERFYEQVRSTAARASDFPIMDMTAAMADDEAVIAFMVALEEYNANPKNPLPEYTDPLPQGQAGAIETVQLSDDGTLASVQDADTGLYGYIDKTGAWRIEPQFQLAYNFSDGRAMVQLTDNSWGYIDRTGAVVIPEVRDSDGSSYPLKSSVQFREGIAAVELDTGTSYDMIYIDLDGNVLFNARGLPKVYGAGYASTYFFGFASNFTNGKAVAARRVNDSTDARMDIEDAPVIIDKSGNILATISKEYYADESGFDPNMMVKIKPGGPFHGEDLYGLCDENGTVVVPCEYPYLMYCENGWYLAQNQEGLYGFIDKTGAVQVEFAFEGAGKFSSGLAPVLIDGLWGFLGEDGELAISPSYRDVGAATTGADPYLGVCTFWDGVGNVLDGDQWTLIDTSGNVILGDPAISSYFSCANGLLAYRDAQSGLLGYLTTDGKIAVEARFFSASPFFPAD